MGVYRGRGRGRGGESTVLLPLLRSLDGARGGRSCSSRVGCFREGLHWGVSGGGSGGRLQKEAVGLHAMCSLLGMCPEVLTIVGKGAGLFADVQGYFADKETQPPRTLP